MESGISRFGTQCYPNKTQSGISRLELIATLMSSMDLGKRFIRLYDSIAREEVFFWTSRFSDYDQSCSKLVVLNLGT